MASKAQKGAKALPAVGTAFLSYSRSDNEFVDRLEAALQARNVHVLRDRHDIAKAEDWWLRIEQLIRAADSIVFVLSPASLASSVTQREIAFAATLNKRVLPVVAGPLAGVEVPEALSRLNYVFFVPEPRAGASGDFEQASDQLLEALTTDIGWIREHTALGEEAHRWDTARRPAHLLLRGPALDAAERWLAARPRNAIAPTALQREYLLAGRQNATKRLRMGVGISVGVAVVSIGLAALAWMQKQAAVAAQTESFVRQADLSASLAFRLYEQGDGLLGLKVAGMGAPEAITDKTPLRPRLALALQRGAAMIREEAGLRHPEGQIDDVAWSPDGRFIATATLADGPRLWRAADGSLVRAFGSGPPSAQPKMDVPRVLSFSTDGRWLAMQVDNRLQVWGLAALESAATATPRLEVACADVAMRAVTLSPDGRFVAARCGDGFRVLQVDGGRAVWSGLKAVNPDSGEPEGGWPEVAFVRGGKALFMLRAGKAQLLQALESAAPQVGELPGLAALEGLRVEATAEPDEVLVFGAQAVVRANLGQQRVLYRLDAKAQPGEWWARQVAGERLMVASQPGGRGELRYQMVDARTSELQSLGSLQFTGHNADATVASVDLSGDGRTLAIGMNTGVMTLRVDQRQGPASTANVQQMAGNALVVLDEPCSVANVPSQRVLLPADGARVATACEGITRVRRLAEPVTAMLGAGGEAVPRVVGMARGASGMLQLVATAPGRWMFERADAATVPGAASAHTPALETAVTRWQAADKADVVYWIDRNGQAGAWDAASGQVTRFEGRYAKARALRVGDDGRQAAVLGADGTFVQLALGQAKPALQAPLLPRPDGAGAIVPTRYDIGPDLASVAFGTQDFKAAHQALGHYGVVVSFAANAAAQARCLAPAHGRPAAVLLGGTAAAPQLFMVNQSHALAAAPLADVLAPGARLAPRTPGSESVAVQACPANLAQALYDAEGVTDNPFTEVTSVLIAGGQQLLYSDGGGAPLELLDVGLGQPLTDLVDQHDVRYPIAVSADAKVFAVMLELGHGVAVFDAATGTLLQRRLTETPLDPTPGALAFDASGGALYARLLDGRVQVITLGIAQGADLLGAIRALGLGTMSEAERRQIYEFRKRFPRVAPAG